MQTRILWTPRLFWLSFNARTAKTKRLARTRSKGKLFYFGCAFVSGGFASSDPESADNLHEMTIKGHFSQGYLEGALRKGHPFHGSRGSRVIKLKNASCQMGGREVTRRQIRRAENGALDPWLLNLRFWGAPIFSPEAPKPLFWRVSERFGQTSGAPSADPKGSNPPFSALWIKVLLSAGKMSGREVTRWQVSIPIFHGTLLGDAREQFKSRYV